MTFAATPADEGFFMPPDWAPQERIWMCWPSRRDFWGEDLIAAKVAYAEIARAVRRFVPVTMLARAEEAGEARLACGRDIAILAIDLDDPWLRDNGPSFVVDTLGRVAGVHWRFNGLGGRVGDCQRDETLGRRLLEHLKLHCFPSPLVLEGGAFQVDGLGTLLASEECLLNPDRNPELTRQEVEAYLATYLGVRRILWLERGLFGDPTGGHVDRLCRFAGAGRVILQGCKDNDEPNAGIVAEVTRRLQGAHDARGRDFELLVLPSPKPRELEGRRLVLSYAGFCLVNGAALVPTFEDPADQTALAVVARAFPDREVIGVPGLALAREGGSIHRITLGQPRPFKI